MKMIPLFYTDGYKLYHHIMDPKELVLKYSNLTPRSNKHAPDGINYVVVAGIQPVLKWLVQEFDESFFNKDKITIIKSLKTELELYVGRPYDVSHFEELHDLGYLPVKIKALPEGTFVPMGIPILTIENTLPKFAWLTNYLETILSNMLWQGMTSATIASQYKKLLLEYMNKTNPGQEDFVDFQAHDFSMRGMGGISAAINSGIGHLLSFQGSDNIPAIVAARKGYGDAESKEMIGAGVPATEHAVMCSATGLYVHQNGGDWSKYGEAEKAVFKDLLVKFPEGILSVVSDTWDLWVVICEYLRDPEVQRLVLSRNGKLVIRPDSGDPVDILCGISANYTDLSKWFPEGDVLPKYFEESLLDEVREDTPHGELGVEEYENTYIVKGKLYKAKIDNISWNRHDKQYYYIDMYEEANITVEELEWKPSDKGVVQLLWDIFGGKINDNGYKILDSHIGCIYGDSITLSRAKATCDKLERKGFASTNVVLGVGSYTYQFNTRDTFGFAIKATYVEVKNESNCKSGACALDCQLDCVEGIDIFKDPVTDDGTKKSARGLLRLDQGEDGKISLKQGVSRSEANGGLLRTVLSDGLFYNVEALRTIRLRVNNNIFKL